jgi:hypothetical protein
MIKLFKKSLFKSPAGIEKTLQTTDGKITVHIPKTLDEITLGQLMQMQEKPDLDDLDAISILSAIPREELLSVKNFDHFQVFSDHIQSLAVQIKYLYYSSIIPKKVMFMIDGSKIVVDVMNNLSVEPAGAFLAARDIIAEEIKQHIGQYGEDDWRERFQPSLKACCHVLAHYFYCRVTGNKYDEYQAEGFCDEIKKMRVTEAMPIAKHFFTCYPYLLKQKIGFSQQLRLYWKKRQALQLLKNLSISIP